MAYGSSVRRPPSAVCGRCTAGRRRRSRLSRPRWTLDRRPVASHHITHAPAGSPTARRTSAWRGPRLSPTPLRPPATRAHRPRRTRSVRPARAQTPRRPQPQPGPRMRRSRAGCGRWPSPIWSARMRGATRTHCPVQVDFQPAGHLRELRRRCPGLFRHTAAGSAAGGGGGALPGPLPPTPRGGEGEAEGDTHFGSLAAYGSLALADCAPAPPSDASPAEALDGSPRLPFLSLWELSPEVGTRTPRDSRTASRGLHSAVAADAGEPERQPAPGAGGMRVRQEPG